MVWRLTACVTEDGWNLFPGPQLSHLENGNWKALRCLTDHKLQVKYLLQTELQTVRFRNQNTLVLGAQAGAGSPAPIPRGRQRQRRRHTPQLTSSHLLLVYACEVLNTGSDTRTSCKRDTDTPVEDPVLHLHPRCGALIASLHNSSCSPTFSLCAALTHFVLKTRTGPVRPASPFTDKETEIRGTSLAVHASTAGGVVGSIPGRGTKILHATQCNSKEKETEAEGAVRGRSQREVERRLKSRQRKR